MRTTLGQTEFFTGAMSSVITRRVKMIKIVADAVFTTLTFQYPAGTVGNGVVAPTTPVSFLAVAGYRLEDVASFRLLSGTIQVIYQDAQQSATVL